MNRRTRDQRHVTEDTAHPPEILILDVAAIGPAVDLDGDDVLARLQLARDVELGRHARVLAITHLLAIDPHVIRGVDAGEVQVDFVACPVFRHSKFATIRSDGIALAVRSPGMVVRCFGYARKISLERIRNVRIDGRAVALHLPVGRHRDFFPAGHVIFGLIEIDGTQLGRLDPMELPPAIQRFDQTGCLRMQSGVFCRIGCVVGAGRLFADTENMRVFPVRNARRGRLRGGAERQNTKAGEKKSRASHARQCIRIHASSAMDFTACIREMYCLHSGMRNDGFALNSAGVSAG